jgi:hypothetical protein
VCVGCGCGLVEHDGIWNTEHAAVSRSAPLTSEEGSINLS